VPQTNENDHAEKSGTEKPSWKNRHGKSDTKKEPSYEDPSFKKDIDDDSRPAWETDLAYNTLRQMNVIAGYDDVKKPADHYDKFKEALKKTTLQKSHDPGHQVHTGCTRKTLVS
jgi:hypothetical protein